MVIEFLHTAAALLAVVALLMNIRETLFTELKAMRRLFWVTYDKTRVCRVG